MVTSFVRVIDPSEIEFELVVKRATSAPSFDDESLNKATLDRSRRGDVWAWCEVGMRAKWSGFLGEAWIGEGSYESEQDFIERSGHYDALVCDAMNDLFDAIERATKKLEPLVTRESVDEWLTSRDRNRAAR